MWHCTFWRWGTCACVTLFTSRTPTSCCHARWCEGEEQWWMLVILVCAHPFGTNLVLEVVQRIAYLKDRLILILRLSGILFRRTSSFLVSALLVQSNSHDIGNEKGSKKFNFQVFWKLEIEFSLEIDFWFSFLLVGPCPSFHSFQLDKEMTQGKPIFILNAASKTFLFLNSNIQSADIVAGKMVTL